MPPADPPAVPTVAYAGVMGGQDTRRRADRRLRRRRPPPSGRRPAAADRPRRRRPGAAPARRRARHRRRGHVDRLAATRRGAASSCGSATVGVSPGRRRPVHPAVHDDQGLRVPRRRTAGSRRRPPGEPGDGRRRGRATSGPATPTTSPTASRTVLFDAERRRELADAAARRAPALLWDRSATRLLAAYRPPPRRRPGRRGRPTRRRRARRDRKLTEMDTPDPVPGPPPPARVDPPRPRRGLRPRGAHRARSSKDPSWSPSSRRSPPPTACPTPPASAPAPMPSRWRCGRSASVTATRSSCRR